MLCWNGPEIAASLVASFRALHAEKQSEAVAGDERCVFEHEKRANTNARLLHASAHGRPSPSRANCQVFRKHCLKCSQAPFSGQNRHKTVISERDGDAPTRQGCSNQGLCIILTREYARKESTLLVRQSNQNIWVTVR